MMKIASLRKVIEQKDSDPMNVAVLHQLFSQEDYDKLIKSSAHKEQKIEHFQTILDESREEIERLSKTMRQKEIEFAEQSGERMIPPPQSVVEKRGKQKTASKKSKFKGN